MRVESVELFQQNAGFENEMTTCRVRINPENHRDQCALASSMRYEERSNMYRGQLGDVIRFFYHVPENETGFGGALYHVTMMDGSKRVIRGPWSSHAGHLNVLFHDREPAIECVDTNHCAVVIRKAALEALGVLFVLDDRVDGGWFTPVAPFKG